MRAMKILSYLLPTILALFNGTCLAGTVLHGHNVKDSIETYGASSLAPALSPQLKSRAIVNMGPMQRTADHGWIISYRKVFSMIIPVEVAASVLEDFVLRGLREVQRHMMTEDPIRSWNAVFISIGSVFLSIECEEGQGVTWSGVEMVLGAILKNLRLGWTSQLLSEWFHPVTGTRLWVSLSMLQWIAARRDGLL